MRGEGVWVGKHLLSDPGERSLVLSGSSISCCSKPLVELYWEPRWWLHYWETLAVPMLLKSGRMS